MANEKKILNLLYNGYHDVNISYNETLSIITYVKIKARNLEVYHTYFYNKYFKKTIDALLGSKGKKGAQKKRKKGAKVKKADQIRINNSDKKIEQKKGNIHRAIKQANIKIDSEVNTLLVNFGVARKVEEDDE